MSIHPDQYCLQKAIQSGSSFYYSFRFLPPKQRQAIITLYAFCREVDDIVDTYKDKSVAERKLTWWQEELNRIFEGHPQHPVGFALLSTLQQYSLPKVLFEEILQGMQMDLAYQGYQTFEDLRVYCHCVASTVGLLSASIFGYQDPKTLEYAKNLGLALQLVNIIRDIGEDARRGRIYIPEEELTQFGLTPDAILSKHYSENFTALMRHQTLRARDYYQKALELLPDIDRHSQRSGLMMGEIYFTLLDEIEKSKFQVLHQRITLTPIRKLWIAWRTYRRLKK